MKNKRNSVHYENLNQAIEKPETQLLFLKDVNIRDSKDFVHKKKQKKSRKFLYFRGVIKLTYSRALTWKVGNECGS